MDARTNERTFFQSVVRESRCRVAICLAAASFGKTGVYCVLRPELFTLPLSQTLRVKIGNAGDILTDL